MKRFLFVAAVLLVFCGCTPDEPSTVAPPEPVEIHWALSGMFGNATIDSVKADTQLSGMENRSGTSTLHLDGFDTAYFEKRISLRHLQVNAGAEVDIDDNGNFTFDNMEVFGLCDGTNSIRITPTVKQNVNLVPSSIVLYSYR